MMNAQEIIHYIATAEKKTPVKITLREKDRGIEVAAEFNTATIAQLAQCDRMDAVIDFSAPASLPALAAYVQRTGTPLVSGTTGYSDEEAARVNALGDYLSLIHI